MTGGTPGVDREQDSSGAPDAARAHDGAELRERAELLLSDRDRELAQQLTQREALTLMHELQVHQIELELQNEELRRAQIELQVSAEHYADLYDFAPVGYLSLNHRDALIRANLAAANMLGIQRRELTGKTFSRFVGPEDRALYAGLRRRLVVPDLTESIELRLIGGERETFWARLEIVARRDPATQAVVWQVAISDIDEQKRAQLLLERVNDELEERVDRRTQALVRANAELLEEIARRRDAEAAVREREESLERRVAERTQQLASLLTISRNVSSTLEVEEILEVILQELERLVRYSGCGIFMLHGELLTLVAYRGPLSPKGLVQAQSTLDQAPLLARVLARQVPVIVQDMMGEEELAIEWRATAGALQRQILDDSRAWLGVPMIAKGRVIGIFRLDHRQPGHFDEQRADLALTLANQAAIAMENARLYSHAQSVAAVEERQRLARELHDSVAQTFYSISLSTHAASAQIDRDPGRARRHLGHVVELASAGLTEMKALIFDLQAENIRREGLVAALSRQLSAIIARNDLGVTSDLSLEPEATLAVKEAAYGIVREALQNVVRHAGATELEVRLRDLDTWLRLEVRDNGVGFEPSSVGERTLGLRSMRERAAAVGGRVEVESAPARGTVVRALLPARVGPER